MMYRIRNGELEVLLVHPGGPFWAKKDAGAWFLPKGELEQGEEPFSAAQREFEEETGLKPSGTFLELGTVKQKNGKIIYSWAFEGDCDPAAIRSNKFTIEWPPKSGTQREFLEIDRAAFFTVDVARKKMHPVEFEFVVRLQLVIGGRSA
jgi:predicted NUDIX family NTP pyrophosphohydrolase